MQSFALWQQATIEFTRRDNSIISCLRHIYMVLFFAHIPFVVNRAFQRNASGVVATQLPHVVGHSGIADQATTATKKRTD